jgi:O-antigen ligase
VLSRLGIETRLQLAITVCLIALIVLTTLGGSGGAPWVFFTYRSLLMLVAILSAIGSGRSELKVHSVFLALTALLFGLMLVSVLRIPGSHFEGFYLWFKYAFFACAFLCVSGYARYQSAEWKGLLLGAIVAVGLVHLLPDLLSGADQIAGFSQNNANYFATFLLIGLAGSSAVAVFGLSRTWRIAAAVTAALSLLGIVKTSSRGATLAAVAIAVVAAARARGRIPRRVWLGIALTGLLISAVFSPYLIRKFVDRGDVDPYNYARPKIWLSSLPVVWQNPVFGVGFGQFINVSKQFTLPVEGTAARYLKRAQMAHNEYLQHMAELGIPAAALLFALLGYSVYLASKRAATAWPEYRCFHEAALLTATGVGTHALVDNCWTIPVTTSALVILSLADPLPLQKSSHRHWRPLTVALGGLLAGLVYLFSVVIPGLGLYYNDIGHAAFDRGDLITAEQAHLRAIAIVPDHSLFLDNLGLVYLQGYSEKRDPRLLRLSQHYFARAIDRNPQALEPHVHLEAALVKSLSGDPEKDRPLFQQIVEADAEILRIDPFLPFPRKNLAVGYYNLGEKDRALKELETAIYFEPNYVPGYLQLSDWYAQRGDDVERQHYLAAAMHIVGTYRNYKPVEAYERELLGRPVDPVDEHQ